MMSRIFGENLKKNIYDTFDSLPFFEICTLQFCNCDISESIKVEARNFHRLVEYNE